jgi:hypothetical protein
MESPTTTSDHGRGVAAGAGETMGTGVAGAIAVDGGLGVAVASWVAADVGACVIGDVIIGLTTWVGIGDAEAVHDASRIAGSKTRRSRRRMRRIVPTSTTCGESGSIAAPESRGRFIPPTLHRDGSP